MCMLKILSILIYIYIYNEHTLKIIRALASTMPKNFYFTTSKPTLSILPSHFRTHPTSQFLFLYTTH